MMTGEVQNNDPENNILKLKIYEALHSVWKESNLILLAEAG